MMISTSVVVRDKSALLSLQKILLSIITFFFFDLHKFWSPSDFGVLIVLVQPILNIVLWWIAAIRCSTAGVLTLVNCGTSGCVRKIQGFFRRFSSIKCNYCTNLYFTCKKTKQNNKKKCSSFLCRKKCCLCFFMFFCFLLSSLIKYDCQAIVP